jgi:hypothetical protein
MRRLLLTAAGLAALMLSAPGAALANHGHNRHHRRHAHHAKVRLEHFGPATTSTVGSGTGSSTGTGTSSGSSSNQPTAPVNNENAGKVASYANGVLTLTLSDGSSVSGKVTNDTQIECVSATPAMPPGAGQGNDDGPGDDNGSGEDNQQGDQHEGDQQPPASAAGQPAARSQSTMDDQGGGNDDQDEEGQSPATTEPPCDTSALLPGAIVRAAELRIGPSGSEFESIVLVR